MGTIAFRKGILYIFVFTLGFSIIPILAKIGLSSNIGASILLFYRFFIAAIFFVAYCYIKKKPYICI